MTRYFGAVAKAVVLVFSLLTSLRGFNIEDNLRECTTNPSGVHIKFCGWELGDNYSRQTIYDCYSKTPEFFEDCLQEDGEDRLLPAHYCRRFQNYTQVRGCYPVWACTPQRDFCGLKNLEEVRHVIISSIPVKFQRKNRLILLNDSIAHGMHISLIK